MGFGDTSKKDKKAAAGAAADSAADKDAEEADWAQGGKKANKKQEAAADKAAAKADRKAAADEQAAAEDAEIATPRTKGKGKGKEAKPKMTQAEIAAKAMKALKDKEKEEKQKNIDIEKSGGNDYIGVLMENDNKKDGIDASGIDEALGALDVGGGSKGAGKKVNMKALFAEFEEREIVRLKVDHPGLKLSQYKERAFSAWQKSPENPKNQEAVDVS